MSSNIFRQLITKCVIKPKNMCFSQNRLGLTYNAAILKEVNKPLIIEQKKIKKLDKKQVRVEVRYCSVNANDVDIYKSNNLKLPFVPGHELSGEIIEVGEGVDKVSAQVGDRVAVLSVNNGGFAEQCVVDVNDVWRVPSKIKLKAAAAMIYGHTNALYAFSHLVQLNEKSKIVISAGSAGLGLAAIDVVANVFKIKPFGVVDTEDRAELVRERGAFKTASFTSKDLKKDLDLKSGADFVYDAVGGDKHILLANCAAEEGHIFYAAPLITQPKIQPPYNTNLTFLNLEALRTSNNAFFRQLVADTLDMADQSLINVHISKSFKLKNVNEAIKFVEDKSCTGKVVIDMEDDDDDDDHDDNKKDD